MRIPYGHYKRLMPVIEEMYMAGVSTGTIAETLGLNTKVLTQRIWESGVKTERDLYVQELAREIAAKHGVAPEAR
jgi:hypothetical protein